jgi:iron complex outermembrane receptor protein
MIKKTSLLFVFICFAFLLKAQQDSSKVVLSGSIKDSETGEALIGATVLAKVGVGVVADLEGNFVLKLPKGYYTIEVSMLGYGKYTQKLKLYSNKNIDVKLESTMLDEIEVFADVAQIRETPVAFSSISAAKIQEELGSRDISMIANTTPGAYATSQGGGAGDSRVNIRGFDQRNIAVMVDGIPVNDMENGQVYWSNWDGLKDITKSAQIQRGLGASKLAVVSIGGTMNFITNGIESKQQMVVKKEWGNNRHNVMALSYNSGIINNKWGFTLAGTYKTGDGWAEGTFTNAYSYFFKVQYMPNPRHIISIGANGAPQSHGQRSTKVPISVYSKDMAKNLGINYDSVVDKIRTTTRYTTQTQGDRDLRWNSDQGILNGGIIGDRINYYHKPLININHFWKISEKTNLSTVVYASFGNGGGTGYNPTFSGRDTLTGYYLVQTKYDANSTFLDANYHPTENKSTTILRSSNNNHRWFGLLSTATSKLNKLFTLTYGIDLRYFKGIHTQTVYNLLGGDYFVESGFNKNPNLNPNIYSNYIKKKGDIYGSNWEAINKWAGLFGQIEFKKDKWSAFLTATGSYSGYNRVDYYKRKNLVLSDTTYYNAIGYGDTIVHNGTTYTRDSKELKDASPGWKWQWGYTLKGGANYNINDHHNVFVNIGWMQIPQKFANVFTFANEVVKDFRPNFIKSYELGYGLKYNKFHSTINAYYTTWDNQPQRTVTDLDGNVYNINGINVAYKGVEFEGAYKPIKQIELEGLFSFGDWKYVSGGIISIVSEDGALVDEINYDANGVHVGDAAQTQIGGAVRFMPIKGLYIKPRYTYFDRYYANFLATDLQDNNKGKESWKVPGYGLFDFNAGYEMSFGVFRLNIYGTVNNVLNTLYISDAQNNGAAGNFDATSATVFFGVGRTFVVGTKLTF